MLDNTWPVLAFHFFWKGGWEDNQAIASECAWSKQIIQNSFSQVLGPFDPLAAFNTINHGILNSLKTVRSKGYCAAVALLSGPVPVNTPGQWRSSPRPFFVGCFRVPLSLLLQFNINMKLLDNVICQYRIRYHHYVRLTTQCCQGSISLSGFCGSLDGEEEIQVQP